MMLIEYEVMKKYLTKKFQKCKIKIAQTAQMFLRHEKNEQGVGYIISLKKLERTRVGK